MANIPSIPPLLSSTPPPIDFGEEDDDPGLPPALTLYDNDEFGDYALATGGSDNTNDDDSSMLHRPLPHELSSSTRTGFTDLPPSVADHCSILTTTNINLTVPSILETDAKTEVANLENAAILTATCTNPIETFNFDVEIKATSAMSNSTLCLKPKSDDSSTKDLVETITEEDSKYEGNNELELNFDCCSSPSLPSLKLDSLSLNNSGKQTPTVTPLSLSLASDDVEKFSDCDEDADELCKPAQVNSIAYCDENKTKESSTECAVSQETFAFSKECSVEKCNRSSMVVMEDIADDSSDDERRSPKKCKNLILDENSEDFFAIHTVGNESNNNISQQNGNNLLSAHLCNEDNDDDSTSLKKESGKMIADTFGRESLLESTSMSSLKSLDHSQTEFNADFSQFNNFTSENLNTEAQQLPQAIGANTIVTQLEIKVIENDDDFDEFQNFNAAPGKTHPQNQIAIAQGMSIEATKQSPVIDFDTKDNNINANHEDDDDDFGDFAEASISTQVPTVNTAIIPMSSFSSKAGTAPLSNQLLNVNSSNLNERMKLLLDMMFPQTNEMENRNEERTVEQPESLCAKLHLDSIDSAKALGYQWINSEMRHSLIKSLGIDSRNILFGEKWNSSMPRFAANLSFNPLQPMKSQSIAAGSTIFSAVGPHSSMNQVSCEDTNATSLATTSLTASKAEVPAVEFDWNSSGLVNPLDGTSKEDTANSREVEAIHTSQSGESNASDATSQQQQQKQSSSYSTDALYSGSCSIGGGQDIDASVDDTSTAASGVSITTAETTIPANVPTDSISHQVDLKPNLAEATNISATGGINSNISASTGTIESSAALTKEDIGFGFGSNYGPSVFSNAHITIGNDDDDDDEVVTTSTYAGPLKETHIYTPPKSESSMTKTIRVSDPAPVVVGGGVTTKTEPIDFDYEIAAAGIIIDETVVKKEYRDVEYNPKFGLEFYNRSNKGADLLKETPPIVSTETMIENEDTLPDDTAATYEDDFSEFQSVPPLTTQSTSAVNSLAVPPAALPITVTKTKDAIASINSRTCSPTIVDKMILSPAILLPQAILLESSPSAAKPKIEWGNSAASINPEELARIEELFPQPKATVKNKDVTPQSASRTSTPTHNGGCGGQMPYLQNSLSISAAIAQKEQNSTANTSNDDDYWSDFVSVSVATTTSSYSNSNSTAAIPKLLNNNNLFQAVTPRLAQHRHQELPSPARKSNRDGEINAINNSNEDEWSDFISSAPSTAYAHAAVTPQFRAATSSSHMPQFNSAAWQNANFYNNPMSFYHQSHTNVSPNNYIRNDNSVSSNNHNNNNNQYLNNYQQRLQEQQQQLQLQQQIHVMQDFSTAVPPQPPYRPNVTTHHHSNQFPIGSAKVSPSISLIPDLGFIAPAMPAHTAFINALPKPNFSTKK